MEAPGYTLNIVFGNDQTKVIDAILKQLAARVKHIEKEAGPEVTHYSITFQTVFDVYVFGREQGNTSYSRLLNLLQKE